MKNIIYFFDIYFFRLFIFYKIYLVDLLMYVFIDVLNLCIVKYGYIVKG